MPQDDEPAGTGFWTLWRSLPGVLTGLAAVIAALATLGALFVGDDRTESPAPGSAPPNDSDGPTATGDRACFGQYFEGVPRDRVGMVEAGARAYDVISENQPKAGTIGLTFSDGRPIGAIRFAFVPENFLFKIESVVDARCKPTDSYENLEEATSTLGRIRARSDFGSAAASMTSAPVGAAA